MQLTIVKISTLFYLEHPHSGEYALLKGRHSLFGWTTNLANAASFSAAWIAKYYAGAWSHTVKPQVITT